MNVTVFNTQLGRPCSYNVTNSVNIPRNISFYSQDDNGYYEPSYRDDYVVRKVKPSVYKRSLFDCYKDEYNFKFTEKKTKTATTINDVYYNERRNRFLKQNRGTYVNNRTEISW